MAILALFERWLNPVADTMIAAAGNIDLLRLRYDDAVAGNWAKLRLAHGYQIAARYELREPWFATAELLAACRKHARHHLDWLGRRRDRHRRVHGCRRYRVQSGRSEQGGCRRARDCDDAVIVQEDRGDGQITTQARRPRSPAILGKHPDRQDGRNCRPWPRRHAHGGVVRRALRDEGSGLRSLSGCSRDGRAFGDEGGIFRPCWRHRTSSHFIALVHRRPWE